MPKALVSRPVEAPAWHRVTTSATSPPHSYCPGSFLRRRIAPASRRPRNVIPGEWMEARVTAGCHRSASKVAGVPAGQAARGSRRATRGKACAFCQLAECRKPLPERSASTQEYRRRWASGANGGEPAVRSGYKTEWPAVMAASRSRRGGATSYRRGSSSKGHTGTLRAGAGYCPEVATPACRSRVRACFRSARPVPARRQAARPTPLGGMPPRRLQQHRRDRPGCVRLVADGLWSSVRCTT
jgi:hypothetical protein